MISIIIPLYDKAAQVRETLDSIRLQLFTKYEVLIVDDGSTDGSLGVVQHYLLEYTSFAEQVRLFSQPNVGVSAARNKALRECRFDWIAFLDADDTWHPDYLKEQLALSRKYPFCTVLACGYTLRRQTGSASSPAKISRLSFRQEDGILDNYFEVAVCSHPPLACLVTMVRRKALESIGGFPEGVSSGEDLLTWARLAVKYRIAYNRKCMAVYNRDPDRFNRDQRNRMPAAFDTVGDCLERLFLQYPHIRGLKEYVGLWHKMRTHIYLSNSMRKEAWMEWRKLARFNPVHYKTWGYLLLFISPVKR